MEAKHMDRKPFDGPVSSSQHCLASCEASGGLRDPREPTLTRVTRGCVVCILR